jgi:PAS domain S-box-containing protein
MHKEMNMAHLDRILVVDDTTANLQLLTNLLTTHGYKVYPASDGELALEFVRSTLPDLILLDIRLPGIDGFEVCRRLKADERTRSIPIIFISILENEHEKVKAFQVGGVDYITKPIRSAEALARVHTHLSLRHAQMDLESRNDELEAARETLEERVAERSVELEQINRKLQQQIDVHLQTLEALRESDAKYRSLIRKVQVAIVLHDGQGRILESNPLAHHLLGLSADQLLGKSLIDPEWHFLREDGSVMPVAEYPVSMVLSTRQPLRGYVTGIRRLERADVTWALVNAEPEYSGTGEISRIIVSFVDITRRKRAEEEICQLNLELDRRVLERTAQLEAANKEMHAFTYTVSHDLRAPLRHIDGFMELLQKTIGTALDEQSRHYMDAIAGAGKKMGLLIDDLLSFSRMGRHALSFKQVELRPLVQDVIRELEPDAAGRNIEWHIGDLPTVGGDAAMLRMVLANLISNALKFTRPRQQAQIEIGSLPGQGSEAVIFVRDNGVGFDMTYADKLFGVFQRLHRADEFEGTGIGLANVRRIIARHGGRTWAEGAVDHGATFFFTLP